MARVYRRDGSTNVLDLATATAEARATAAASNRSWPNILVTGTPGVGKSSLCRRLLDAAGTTSTEEYNDENSVDATGSTGFEYIDLSKHINDQRLYQHWDDDFDVPLFDDEMVAQFVQDVAQRRAKQGGLLVDFHSCGSVPLNLFDIVVVVRATTSNVFDRLIARGYHQKKVDTNVESEIFQIVLDEMREAAEAVVDVWELPSNTPDDLDGATQLLMAFTVALRDQCRSSGI